MAFSPDSKTVFVTLQDTNQLAAIDLETQTIAWKMPIGKQPAGMVMTPDSKYLLIGILGGNYVEVVDWKAKAAQLENHYGKGSTTTSLASEMANMFSVFQSGREHYFQNKHSDVASCGFLSGARGAGLYGSFGRPALPLDDFALGAKGFYPRFANKTNC